MSRPRKNRNVFEPPLFTEFKPLGIRANTLDIIELTLDELESIRLADDLSMTHEEAAEEMGISRSTFSRLIEKSRKKIASFILKGKMLKIGGGDIHFSNNILRCLDCGKMFKTNIHTQIEKCPECNSSSLLSLAGGFGHGACCQ